MRDITEDHLQKENKNFLNYCANVVEVQDDS